MATAPVGDDCPQPDKPRSFRTPSAPASSQPSPGERKSRERHPAGHGYREHDLLGGQGFTLEELKDLVEDETLPRDIRTMAMRALLQQHVRNYEYLRGLRGGNRTSRA